MRFKTCSMPVGLAKTGRQEDERPAQQKAVTKAVDAPSKACNLELDSQ